MTHEEWMAEIDAQIDELFANMKGIPKTDRYRHELTRSIADMMGDSDDDITGRGMSRAERLDWLVSVFISDVGEWPARGIVEMRAIYGSFFPCKGSPESTLPGWTLKDLNGSERSPLALPRIEEEKPKYEATPMTAEEQAQWDRMLQETMEKFKQKREMGTHGV